MTLYKNKYRVETIRLKEWDYSRSGYYFVTICTKDKLPFFGKIDNGVISLSEIGIISEQEWIRIEQIRDKVQLDSWIIMPNHIHGIVVIDKSFNYNNSDCRDAWHASQIKQRGYKDRMIIQNLSNIIRGFKSSATKRIFNRGYSDFSWQSRFYEHIIRTEKSLDKIREYIADNPAKWEFDKYYVKA